MNRLFYPALFHKAEEGGYWISFPDFPECLTQGETMNEAYNMAVDALGLCLTDMEREHITFPEPSDVSIINIEDGATIVIIEFDMLAYKKRTNSKAVKKTLTIPEWLNEEATASGINFSQVLQEALMAKLEKAN
jgi:predicted RNase H-like HicB family nuclease